MIATPPREDSHNLGSGIRWSLYVHGALLVLLVLKSWVFPPAPMRVIPTLRVDLVGLPDQLKKDLQLPSREQKEAATPSDSRSTERTAKPIAEDDGSMKLKQDAKSRDERMKSTLAKMKALAKIRGDSEATRKASPLLKGNQVSPGTSVSGEAREAAEASYYDRVRDRLASHWALPVFLARKSLSARVLLTLDARGRVLQLRFEVSSGNTAFDEQVRRSIQEAQPLPPPPREVLSMLGTHSILVGFPL